MNEIDQALQAAAQGDPAAADRLFALLYADLHRLASSRLRQAGEHTLLDTTSLVHESFLRLRRASPDAFPDLGRFMAYAARAMRSVVVDLVRRRQADRRGGDWCRVTWRTGPADDDGQGEPIDRQAEEVLRVDEALADLAREEPRLASVVELRYFGGLSDAEIAGTLGVTLRTVQRDWAKARLYLAMALR